MTRRFFLWLLASLGFITRALSAQESSRTIGEREFVVTAYCPCEICCGKKGRPTASGKMPVAVVTVAGPRWIAFGTDVWIEGVGLRRVDDRTAKKYEGTFDVFVLQHDEAKRFGRQKLKVKILSNTY